MQDRQIPSQSEGWDTIHGEKIAGARTRPPMRHWLLYRFFGTRVPYEYRRWVRDDALGRGFSLRQQLGPVLLVALIAVVLLVVDSRPRGVSLLLDDQPLILMPAIAAMFFFAASGQLKKRILETHEFFPDGTPYEAGPPSASDGGATAGTEAAKRRRTTLLVAIYGIFGICAFRWWLASSPDTPLVNIFVHVIFDLVCWTVMFEIFRRTSSARVRNRR